MASSKQRPDPLPQRSLADLEHLIELSENKLIFLDVHAEWCGPATALNPFLNQLWVDLEEPDKRILLTTVSTEAAGKEGLKMIQKWAGSDVKVESNGCKPLFILLRHQQAVGVVDGLNTPVIRMMIDLNIPKLVKASD